LSGYPSKRLFTAIVELLERLSADALACKEKVEWDGDEDGKEVDAE
jgi:hypothetical protein